LIQKRWWKSVKILSQCLREGFVFSTDEEYAALAKETGAVERLSDYDKLRQDLSEARVEIVRTRRKTIDEVVQVLVDYHEGPAGEYQKLGELHDRIVALFSKTSTEGVA